MHAFNRPPSQSFQVFSCGLFYPAELLQKKCEYIPSSQAFYALNANAFNASTWIYPKAHGKVIKQKVNLQVFSSHCKHPTNLAHLSYDQEFNTAIKKYSSSPY